MSDKGTNIGEAFNVSWGVSEKFNAYGFLQSDTQNGEGDVAELKDEVGQVVGMHIYNRRKTRTAEVTCKKNAKVPQFGDDVSVDGKKYLCRGVSVTAQNEQFKRLSLTLEAYENLTGYNDAVVSI